jgi:hypothetical protein
VVRAEVQRGGQRRRRHAEPDRTGHQHEAPPARACNRESDHAGCQQAERDAAQLGAGRKRTEARLGAQPGFGPGQQRTVGERRAERFLQTHQHLAQAKRQRRRKQQPHRPQHKQRQPAGTARDEPAIAHRLPALDAAEHVHEGAQRRAGDRAERVQHQVDVGRHALRQEVLQELHREGQARAEQHRRGRRSGDAASAAHQRTEEQRPEGQVAEQVGDEVEAGPPARPGQPQEVQQGDARVAPAVERVQARIDDQRHIQPRQRHGGAAMAGHAQAGVRTA